MSRGTRVGVRNVRRAHGFTAAAVGGALVVVSGACGGSRPVPAQVSAPTAAPAHLVDPARRLRADEHAPAHAHAITTIGRRAIGPFAARAGDAGIAAWIVGSSKGSGQDLYVVPLGPDGAPLGAPAAAASMADGAMSLVVRPSGLPRGGWLVAWTALMDRGEALTVATLDPGGAPRGAPVEVQRTTDHLAWFDFVPSPKGVVCTWAEETSSGEANLLAAVLDPDGRPTGLPARVARGVTRWDVTAGAASGAAPGASGAGLALVDSGGAEKPGPGKLTWERLDGDGRQLGSVVPIGTAPTVSSDIEAVPVDDGWLLGWTDRSLPDAQVTLARVDASGHVEGPVHPLEAVGSSSLVALASGPKGALLAWESPRATAHPLRELHLAGVSRAGPISLRSATSLEITSKASPEFVSTDSGFGLLAVSRACLAGPAPARCAGPLTPTFVRLGSSLEPVQSEPILLGEDRAPAALAWALHCAGDRCSALAAKGDTPTSVFSVDFEPRASPFAAPIVPTPPPDAPRVTGLQSIAAGQSFADLASARVGGTTLLATLALPAPASGRDGGRKAPTGATISLHAVDSAGRVASPPTIVSSRAVPVGGVAIAVAPRPEDGAIVAWVKRDDGDPQVHLARIDGSGRYSRPREVQLTTAKGDASSVAVATVDDGWLVAWVDGRDGNGEVYAAKVDFQLSRVSREERITTAPGDAADVALTVAPGKQDPRVWLAWSDPRESASEGLGDIYVTQLRARDAKRSGDEVRVLTTAAHSRSPQIVPVSDGEDGAVVAWLEEGPAGLDAPAVVMVARLDRLSHPVGSPAKVAFPGDSRPSVVALAAEDGPRRVIRAVVARSSGDAVTLDAARIGVDGALLGPPTTLLDLEAAAPFDAALSLSGDSLFFDDAGSVPTERRVRRLAIDWRR